jgi:hypothetical protein
MKPPAGRLAFDGPEVLKLSPTPNWQYVLSPQHQTSPLRETAQVCSLACPYPDEAMLVMNTPAAKTEVRASVPEQQINLACSCTHSRININDTQVSFGGVEVLPEYDLLHVTEKLW